MYYGKTEKTLTRDINALREMELIRRRKGEFEPNKGIIEALRPVTAKPPDASERVRSS